ncbi:MAG TPA: hypothetical protein VL738_40440 [Dactylosporangium sp.]|nr:hypothetical protein [Dactylosporangium sp.]
MKHLLAFGVVAAGTAAALAGCGGQQAAPSAAASGPGNAPAVTTTTGAATVPIPTAPAATGTGAAAPNSTGNAPAPTATTAVAAAAGANACPVTSDTLYTALRASADMYKRAGSPAALETPVCYQGFATARTKPDGQHQPSRVVFGYQAATRQWTPLNLGSSDYCAGFVPEAVAEKLGNC